MKTRILEGHSIEVLKLTKGRKMMKSSSEQMFTINQIVQDAVSKAEDLNTQSEEISKLLLVIDINANQTNILALKQ